MHHFRCPWPGKKCPSLGGQIVGNPTKQGDLKPPLGDYLGDLTNKITSDHGPDMHITQFVCGGPN